MHGFLYIHCVYIYIYTHAIGIVSRNFFSIYINQFVIYLKKAHNGFFIQFKLSLLYFYECFGIRARFNYTR